MPQKKSILFTLMIILVPASIGISTGVVTYTFHYANGLSYFKNDPKACMNCHIMKPHYDSWNQSTHRAVSKCNDCHAPNNFMGKMAVKAINGFNHSWAFTFNSYHDPIAIKSWNRKIAETSCLNCHIDLVDHYTEKRKFKEMSCLKCHQGVGHSP